jgi:hypothetical protein
MLAPTVKDGLLRILLCDYPLLRMRRRQSSAAQGLS